MKARLPLTLLVVSAVFNAFFLAGFLRARSDAEKPRTFREKADRIAARLGLDEHQRPQFDNIVDEFDRLRKDRTPQRDAFLAELVKENPDEKALQDYVTGEAADDYRLKRLSLTRQFVALLRPEQRKKFEEMIRQRVAASD